MESHFGIANVWVQGDFVTRAVAVLLIGMSLASWIVIIIKALDILKFKKHARQARDFWHSDTDPTAVQLATLIPEGKACNCSTHSQEV